MKVAIVHDWLIGGGAERVVQELHRMFPQAPIYASYTTGEWSNKLDGKVVTGYLQYWPFSKARKFIPPLRGLWFSRLKLDNFDLVISSSGAEAKFIKTKPGTTHIAYIHAPTHYYWSRYDDYLKNPGFGIFDWLARLGLMLLVGPMRRWDYKSAQRPDHIITNSNYTRAQVKKYYGRDSTVIHPPVDAERFKVLNKSSISRKGFVIAGRQTSYKRFDLAIAACTELSLPLRVIGDGPEHRKLRKMAGPTIEFVSADDTQMANYFREAKAFIFPGLDDFGVVAVEAMAAGTPIIAYKGGGALDYIIPGKTGLFFNKQSVDDLATTIKSFNSSGFDSLAISHHAQTFSAEEFRKKMIDFLTDLQKS